MKDHVVRCLRILAFLPRDPGRVTTSEIYRKLEVEGFDITKRTLQRDLGTLSRAFPISSERQGQGLAWYWRNKATLFSIPSMDVYTALTFLLAEANIKELFPASISPGMHAYFEAARDVLKKKNQRHLKNWKEKIRFAPRVQPLIPADIRPEVIRNVHDALLRDERLQVDYRRPDNSRSRKIEEINPLALVHTQAVIYLVCTFWGYQDVRHLPLHRFRLAKLSGTPAVKPAGFELEEYLQKEKALEYPWGGDIRLDALFDAGAARHLQETLLSKYQVLRKHSDERVRLTATVRDTSQLRWWLLGFGAGVEVIGPASLREEFAETARDMRKLYQEPRAGTA